MLIFHTRWSRALPVFSRITASLISPTHGVPSFTSEGVTNLGIGLHDGSVLVYSASYFASNLSRSAREGFYPLPLECLYHAVRYHQAPQRLSVTRRASMDSPTPSVLFLRSPFITLVIRRDNLLLYCVFLLSLLRSSQSSTNFHIYSEIHDAHFRAGHLSFLIKYLISSNILLTFVFGPRFAICKQNFFRFFWYDKFAFLDCESKFPRTIRWYDE
jgi:hypothetical protein